MSKFDVVTRDRVDGDGVFYRTYAPAGSPDGWGIIAVVVRDPRVGWAIICRSDYYIELTDSVVGVDRDGLMDYVVNAWGRVVRVMVGRMISRAEFEHIYNMATEDLDFARKSGYLVGEARPDG